MFFAYFTKWGIVKNLNWLLTFQVHVVRFDWKPLRLELNMFWSLGSKFYIICFTTVLNTCIWWRKCFNKKVRNLRFSLSWLFEKVRYHWKEGVELFFLGKVQGYVSGTTLGSLFWLFEKKSVIAEKEVLNFYLRKVQGGDQSSHQGDPFGLGLLSLWELRLCRKSIN